ncbi:MAG: HPr family phosphocarrier protein, partial [Actinomycetes bacterium]|nr:HPr family phosphocarrier protein [Actinomycetes bacterium]MDX5380211.1 HPr family phosphocarrier protein [Actinomycetes bacterium]MDX5398894.1 HPr family phosphocarrier protein [Actinomycetes bacterium]MDX5449935.1 HPr family phosphocarrier protein [Actinomycetes bacterium]
VFDLDQVATNAKSLLTQMVISNSEVLGGFEPRSGFVTAGEDAVAEAWVGEAVAEGEAVGHTEISEAVLVPNPTGLHARPASVLASLAKKFESQIRLPREDVQVNAKSLIAIMSLNVAYGDKVQFIATGDDAEAAVAELEAAVRDGLGEDVEAVPTAEAAVHEPKEAPLTRQRSEDPNVLVGVAASPGLGVGTVYQLRRAEIVVEEEASDRHYERRQLNAALDRAALDLKALESNLLGEAEPDKAAIFTAHRELLEDPDLLDLANSAIDKGKTAAFAWRGAYTTYAARLAKLHNEILAGRAVDVSDVGQRVLEELTGQRAEKEELPEGSILVAEDLTPSDTATLDRERVAGFATTSGGATSHVAILARSLDIPAVAGIEARALDLPNGSRVILDGAKGTVRINVTEEEVAAIRQRQARHAEKRA